MSAWLTFAVGLGIVLSFGCLALALVQVGSAYDQSMGCSDDEVEP